MDEVAATASGRPLPPHPPLPFSPVTAGRGVRRRRQREQLQEAMVASAAEKERELERFLEEMERDSVEMATRKVAELKAEIIASKDEYCGTITSCVLVFGCLFIVCIIVIPFHYTANAEYQFKVKVLLINLDFVIKLMQSDIKYNGIVIRSSTNNTDTANNVNRLTRIRDYINKTNVLFGA